jgi:hypothetical protein
MSVKVHVGEKENPTPYNQTAHAIAQGLLAAAILALWHAGAQPADIRDHVERSLDVAATVNA